MAEPSDKIITTEQVSEHTPSIDTNDNKVELSSTTPNKVLKKKKRRRNYDDLDNEVLNQELEKQKLKKSVTTTPGSTSATTNADADGAVSTVGNPTQFSDDSDDELDDEALDNMIRLEGEEDDDLDEIDLSILDQDNDADDLSGIGGRRTSRRTRGKIIDYTKTAELLDKEQKAANASTGDSLDNDEEEDDDDDEEDDEDFVPS